MTVIRHLPAIIVRAADELHHTMTTACGRRGLIASRDTAEGGQLELIAASQGPGAVLWAKMPAPWRCGKCGAPGGGSLGFNPVCIAVVVREDRTPPVRRTAA